MARCTKGGGAVKVFPLHQLFLFIRKGHNLAHEGRGSAVIIKLTRALFRFDQDSEGGRTHHRGTFHSLRGRLPRSIDILFRVVFCFN